MGHNVALPEKYSPTLVGNLLCSRCITALNDDYVGGVSCYLTNEKQQCFITFESGMWYENANSKQDTSARESFHERENPTKDRFTRWLNLYFEGDSEENETKD